MKTLVVLVLCWIISVFRMQAAFARKTKVKSEEMSNLLNKLLDSTKHDSRLRPNYGDGPLMVTVGFWILSIEKIDVADMDFTIDLFLRQEWFDKRLDHSLNRTITLNRGVWKKIWIPDTYFVNAKMGKLHRVSAPNVMLTLGPGGLVKYNTRVTIKAACPINLKNFPMDVQVCPLTLESYGYNDQHIKYKWEESGTDGEKFKPSEMSLVSSYVLTKIDLSLIKTQYYAGIFSGVRADFTFERSYSYFLSHMYGTSTAIVFISWIGFVVPVDQPAARIALGITSVLTEITILNMMNKSMPKVSYVKSSDKYLIGCFIFVFLTLVEYCAVLLLKAKQKPKTLKVNNTLERPMENDETKQSTGTNWMFVPLVEKNSNDQLQQLFTNSCSSQSEEDAVNNHKQALTTSVKSTQSKILTDDFISSIDEYAFRSFPVVFAIYNAIYWLDYL